MRTALIEAAATLIAKEGGGGLTLRGLADEVGTSTMAIYTHFGGMSELRRAVRREGFARLADRVAQLPEGADPVADLAILGREYYAHAMSNPDLYRVMFMEEPLDAEDADARAETFGVLVATVERCVAAGRFAKASSYRLATQFWAVGHGVAALQLAGLLSADEAIGCLTGVVENLFVGFGDDRAAARRALRRAGTGAQG